MADVTANHTLSRQPGADHAMPGADPRLCNEDLAPVPIEKRTWTG